MMRTRWGPDDTTVPRRAAARCGIGRGGGVMQTAARARRGIASRIPMWGRVESQFPRGPSKLPARAAPLPMFDLFKRKPAAKAPAPAESSVEPPTAAPTTTALSETSAEPPEATAIVEAPAATGSEKRSWRERLKSGLGLSRDKLSGALSGVFRRRVLDEAALEELE